MADISRTDAGGIIVDANINEILQDSPQGSASLATFRTIRMGTKIGRIPILETLPTATWLSGDDSQKSTSEAHWGKKTLTAEELAVIVPIPQAVFDDTEFGVWEEIRPRVAEAFSKALDAAVFVGAGAPASFDDDLVTGAGTATQTVTEGDFLDLAEDINQAWGLVEAVGFDVNVQYASRRLRVRLRGLRDENNQPIYLESLRSDRADRTLMGEDIVFVQNGAFDTDVATMIVGDRTKAIIGLRQDVEMRVFDQGVLTDGAGVVTLSLMEQDAIALRATFRAGFVVANTVSSETGNQEYPFAVLEPAAS
jgi:HK97 family phage major capsid protein